MATRQIPWARVLVEGVVIVASILLAFGIDAWWDERQEREQVRQDLENVAQELVGNRDRIMFQMDMMERVVAAQESFLEAMGSSAGAPSVSVADTLAWLLAVIPTLNASLGAVDALVASGRLALIEAPGIRASLAGLRDGIGDAVEGQLGVIASLVFVGMEIRTPSPPAPTRLKRSTTPAWRST